MACTMDMEETTHSLGKEALRQVFEVGAMVRSWETGLGAVEPDRGVRDGPWFLVNGMDRADVVAARMARRERENMVTLVDFRMGLV